MARDFSEDGAIGAMTGNTPAAASTTGAPTSLTPSIMNNFNMTGTPADAGSTMPIGIGDSSIGGSGGYGGGGMTNDSASQTNGVGGIPSGMAYPSGGYGDSGGWGGGAPAGGSYGGGADWSFARGGAIDEDMGGDPNATDPQGSMMGNRLQQQINQALSTVDNIMSYGRQLHGIGGGGQQQAMNDTDFRHSDNIEDRTGNDTSPKDRISQNVSNNSANLVDKVTNMFAPDPTKNKMSQDAGINDIGSSGSSQAPAQAGAQQAIDTGEEEAQ